MNNFTKLLLLISALSLTTACSKIDASQGNVTADNTSTIADRVVEDREGIIKVNSPFSVAETSDRLAKIITDKGLTLFARIDHSDNAQKAGLELKPTQVIIFGNPKVGTPLMNCSATTAIDLPQKFLIVEREAKQTQIIYNSPQYLQQRHNITGCDEVLNKVSEVLKGISEAASK